MAPVRRLGDRQWLLRPAKSVVLGSNPSDCRKAVIAQSVVRVNAFVDQFQLSYRVHFVAIANRPSCRITMADSILSMGMLHAHASGFMVPRGVSNSFVDSGIKREVKNKGTLTGAFSFLLVHSLPFSSFRVVLHPVLPRSRLRLRYVICWIVSGVVKTYIAFAIV